MLQGSLGASLETPEQSLPPSYLVVVDWPEPLVGVFMSPQLQVNPWKGERLEKERTVRLGKSQPLLGVHQLRAGGSYRPAVRCRLKHPRPSPSLASLRN